MLTTRRPLIVVSGAIANKPRNGGAAWTRLSWVLGLKRLGCDVYFVEQIASTDCADESGARCDVAGSMNRAYFVDTVERFGLADRSALVEVNGRATAGLAWQDLERIAEAADLLVNISGHLTIGALKDRFRTRVFLDQDPGYTQFWHASGLAADRLRGHDFYFTVGENIGSDGCEIPTCGIKWHPIRQPVLLDEWPMVFQESDLCFTTVASWRGPYGRIVHNGVQYGLKAHEFRKFAAVPHAIDRQCEVALTIDHADRRDLEALETGGWRVVNPASVAGDPFLFRQYVQASGAEFSVAQGIYVETHSGWFSDRTARYLASGKPALVQDTGLARNYPVGCGIVPFRTFDEAVRGARHIARDYEAHAHGARAIAEEFFDSDKVISGLLQTVGVTS